MTSILRVEESKLASYGIGREMQNYVDANSDDVVYKDVVVIGNGPSGICLSYMLAGNWPYYTGEPHPGDEMLTARLHIDTSSTNEEWSEIGEMETNRRQGRKNAGRKADADRGLAASTRCKLECLSSGLEGRAGGRPLALLMDQLQHPCVDAGLDVPSLLTWKSAEQHPEHKVIDHVVLGKGQPGGSWQVTGKTFAMVAKAMPDQCLTVSMDPNVLTISLNRWMSLPDLDIRQWEMLIESEHHRKTNETEGEPCAHYAFQEKPSACKTASRISVGTVAAYYKDYVRKYGLEQYFRCGTIVTSVRPDCPSATDAHRRPADGVEDHPSYGWIVDGFERQTGRPFRYRCKRVVLATGTTDLPNKLDIPDENSDAVWLTHDLNELESRLDRLVDRQQHGIQEQEEERRVPIDPVLVIGAGLSAADAIMAARFRGISVLHAFRDSSNEWNKPNTDKIRTTYDRLQGLPSSMYPEYHKVYEMMADGGTNYPLYRALPGYTLLGFTTTHADHIDSPPVEKRTAVAALAAPDGRVQAFRVSIVAILIGYKPDLSYLEAGGIGLGKFPDRPIDGKSNPIEVDNFTYEVIKAPRNGLYALGPLVGDNFVRYILGGAFGILVHILTSSPSTT